LRLSRDGTPADPPVLHTSVPNWAPGDTIPLTADRTLRVVETRLTEQESVLVVEFVQRARERPVNQQVSECTSISTRTVPSGVTVM
jgi:hypothetical protein